MTATVVLCISWSKLNRVYTSCIRYETIWNASWDIINTLCFRTSARTGKNLKMVHHMPTWLQISSCFGFELECKPALRALFFKFRFVYKFCSCLTRDPVGTSRRNEESGEEKVLLYSSSWYGVNWKRGFITSGTLRYCWISSSLLKSKRTATGWNATPTLPYTFCELVHHAEVLVSASYCHFLASITVRMQPWIDKRTFHLPAIEIS